MRSVKNVLYKLIEEQKIAPKDAMLVFKELQSNEKYLEDDIAVIGMSGRLPKAKNPEEYWRNLKAGVNCISKLPEDRKEDIESLFNKEQKKNVTYSSGGYMNEIDKFDASFFRISPKEAKYMEPEQRLFLETVWEAIEDAGYSGMIYGTKTGIYVGHDHVSGSIYRKYTGGMDNEDTLALTGTYPSILPSRISYILNLQGPSLVIDTACSSGLVAVHEACQAIKNKECDMAIAGGVNLLLWPVKFKSFKMVETNNDIVKTFDKNSSGTVWGEGVCAFILKPLSKALEDRDNIHAVIKGSAINNDGISSGITAPNAEAQENVIVKAWEDAKINPETISYIETHGTGTVLGDPIEIKALKNAFSRYTDKRQFCAIGSLKPSTGHLVGASGTASLMKVIMALKNREIPATINFEEPNPYINFCDSQLFVNDRLRKWETDGCPRRSGISSFGFSGTNCHMIIEEAPEAAKKQNSDNEKSYVLVLSAKSSNALGDLVELYNGYLDGSNESLEDICFTACTGREHYEHRIAFIVKEKQELLKKIRLIRGKRFDEIKEKGIYFGAYKLVNRHRDGKADGELTEAEKQSLSETANTKIKEMLENKTDREAMLELLCNYYIQGADIDWHRLLYAGQSSRRVSLPVYPFEKIRFWFEPILNKDNEQELKGIGSIDLGEKVNPLLGYCLADTISHVTYMNRLTPENSWVVRDHKLIGRNVLPGTGCLEMVRAACERLFKDSAMEFKEVIFFTPLFIGEEEIKEVYTILSKKDEYVEFVVSTMKDDKWAKHVEGKALKIRQGKLDKYNLDDISRRCSSEISLEKIKEKTDTAEFNGRWNSLGRILTGQNEMLITLELPGEYSGDLDEYITHPAMMDNAVNIEARIGRSGVYAPFSYKNIKFFNKLPGKFYSYVSFKEEPNINKETASFDIALLDESGKVLVEIENYTIKRVHEKDLKASQADLLYRTCWVPVEMKAGTMDRGKEGSVIAIKGESKIGENFIKALRDKGINVIEVDFGAGYGRVGFDSFTVTGSEADYKTLFKEVEDRNITRIIHLNTLANGKEIKDIETLEGIREKGIYSLFRLTRSIVESKFKDSMDLALVTDYANDVTGDEERINPHNTMLIGFGKIVSQEYSNIKCRCIDIDDYTKTEDIIAELWAENRHYSAAYRKGKRYTEKFIKVNLDKTPDRKIIIKEGGVYVITGGTGGIGLEIAKYLSMQSKVNICLINRSKLPAREDWDDILERREDTKAGNIINAIKAIEDTGSKVQCYSADVAIEKEMDEVLQGIRKSFGKINGVIHGAGIAGNGFIMRKDEQTFSNVIAPKMLGTWILDKLTAEDGLDFFVLFSSIMAVMGSAGQSDYGAANSYLEAFEAYRNKKGMRTITISWAPWKETGMAADNGFTESRGVFKPLPTSAAVQAFGSILEKDLTRVIIGEIDYEIMGPIMEYLPVDLSEDLKKTVKAKAARAKFSGRIQQQDKNIDVVLNGRDSGKYDEIEMKTGKIWASVLDVREIDIYDSFIQLGGDSIIAANLLKEMEMEFGNIVDISDIFTYPTIGQIADYIRKETEKKSVSKLTIEEIMDLLAKGKITVSEASELRKKL
ncbi:MAG: type I polyketide synthase [Clostridia bacterium]|nr:type I polyketide synthase [Clostridia bacterium]